MKKIFTLLTLLVLAMTVNAQETYRKSWDFTKWSATTITNLKAEAAKTTVSADGTSVTDNGALWSDCEKTKECTTYPISKDNCYWQTGNSDGGIVLTANGENIVDTEGLTFTNESARNLAIATNYPDCSSISGAGFGPYHGGSYLWLGGKEKNYFIIPGIAPGTTIKMGIESHKLSDARGVKLFIAKSKIDKTHGTQLKAPDGTEVAAPTVYADQEWLLPTDIPETDQKNANEDGTYNVVVYNTNGCHVYYITVGDGDAPQTVEAKKVAYLGTNEDFALGMFDDGIVAATVVDAVPAIDALQENYDALVIGTGATEAQLAAVKDIIAFFPVVNTNPALYAALGLGSAAEAASSTLTITDTNNAIFEGVDDAFETAGISALTLGDYFAKDQILAKAGDAVAMHVHNAGRNAYYFVPVDEKTEALQQLLTNAIIAASKTKKAVTAVGKPSVTFKQEDGKSIVTITAANAQTIYYTTDGSTPDLKSSVYTEPFELTQESTVRAFATGDGYTTSDGVSVLVTIAQKLAAPAIAVSREAGKSTVTITAAEGAKVYYNFTGSNVTGESAEYSEPVVMTEPATMTVFATAENMLSSDKVQQFVGIDGIDASNIRWDVIAHMGGERDEWSTVGSEESRSNKVNYIFGKNAKSMYTDEVDHTETVKDSEGNDSIINVYKTVEQIVVPNVSGTWKVTSYGQAMTWEQDGVIAAVGSAGRNPETVFDMIGVNDSNGITNMFLNFKGKASGERYNATIQTADKYAGPFDIIVYLCNGDKNQNYPKINVEFSADGETWTKIDTLTTHAQRFIKRTKLSYEGTDEVYIRLAHVGGGSAGQVFDIYLMNNGEKSKAYNEETVGISTVKPAIATKAAIYNLNGVRQQSLKRGLNIIIENGKARKVMVK